MEYCEEALWINFLKCALGMSVKLWHNCGKPQFRVVFPKDCVVVVVLTFQKCGRGPGCGGQNLQIVVAVGVGVVICDLVVVVAFTFKKLCLWFGFWYLFPSNNPKCDPNVFAKTVWGEFGRKVVLWL